MAALVFIAIKSLLHNRVSVLMMLAAVTIGVGLQIPNSANLNGYSHELFEEGVVRSTGHLVVTAVDSEPLDDVAQLKRTLQSFPFVRSLNVRYTHGGVLFRQERHLPVAVTGFEPAAEQAASGFCDRLLAGRCLTGDDPQELVVGQEIAEKLGLAVGDRVRLVLPVQSMGELEFRKEKYQVRGILQGGGFSATDYGVFVNLAEIYRLIGWEDTATSIHLQVDQPDRAAEYSGRVQAALAPAQVKPWFQANEFVARAITGNRTISTVSMSMTILAVLVPVLALLFIHVLAERRQIATLLAIGLARRALFWLYLLRAALIGAIGSAAGLGLGLLLCVYFAHHPIFAMRGFEVQPLLDLESVLIPLLTVFGVTLLGGLIPALRAAHANPSQELRAS